MNILEKIASVLMLLCLYNLKGASGEDDYDYGPYPPSLDAAFNLQWAKMAVQNTISHFLQTGEWKQVGCPYSNETSIPFQYVTCFSDEDFTSVLHPNPAINGTNVKENGGFLYEDVHLPISKDASECSCDHHSFWTLSTWEWSDSDQIGKDVVKTGLVTKVFASEREDLQNYDTCTPTPSDTVYICLAGVWEVEIVSDD